MKTVPLFAVLIVAGLALARGQEAVKENDPRPVLKRLEATWSNAIVARDVTAIDRILADEYVLTTPEGRLVTKAQILKTLRAPADPSFVIKGADLDEMTIRFYGEVALVSSRFTLKVEAEGRNIETPFRHTDVFVKQPGGWRCEARQATRIRQSYGQDPAGGDRD